MFDFLPHAHELVRTTFEVQLTAILKHIADAVKKVLTKQYTSYCITIYRNS